MSHVEPGAVIANVIDRFGHFVPDSKLDPGMKFLAGELPGVVQQVLEGAPQEAPVPMGSHVRGDPNLDGSLWLRRLKIGEDGSRDFGQIDCVELHFTTVYLCQRQEAVDEF